MRQTKRVAQPSRQIPRLAQASKQTQAQSSECEKREVPAHLPGQRLVIGDVLRQVPSEEVRQATRVEQLSCQNTRQAQNSEFETKKVQAHLTGPSLEIGESLRQVPKLVQPSRQIPRLGEELRQVPVEEVRQVPRVAQMSLHNIRPSLSSECEKDKHI